MCSIATFDAVKRLTSLQLFTIPGSSLNNCSPRSGDFTRSDLTPAIPNAAKSIKYLNVARRPWIL